MKNTELEAIIEKHDLVGKSYDKITLLWDSELEKSGYRISNILEYINQHYAIKPDVMRELKKDENVRSILEGKVELEVGKIYEWSDYENENVESVILKLTKNKDNQLIGYGFVDGVWVDEKVFYSTHHYDEACVKLKEVDSKKYESMLVKKLEADGLKVGVQVESLNLGSFLVTDSKFVYHEQIDCLVLGRFVVYEKGKFAKIIQPELTIEQRLERLEKLNNL